MMKVGITGGIGSGKSLACGVLQAMGVPVFFADEEAKQMYDEDAEVKRRLVGTFGAHLYNSRLDRKALAAIVFGNPQALAALNAIAHPAVARRFSAWALRQQAPYVVEEAALLFESKAHLAVDSVVALSAPEDLRIRRTMQRDGCSEEEVRRRMSHQLHEEERNRLADFVVVNDDRQPLLPQLLEVHRAMLRLSSRLLKLMENELR